MRQLSLTYLAAVCLLTACASNKPLTTIENIDRYQQRLAAVTDWELKGRINVAVPGDSDTVNVTWENQDRHYNIYLRGTFGVGATRILGEPGWVQMTQSGEQPIVAHSAEELLYTQLGREIPISDLYYWIRGLPAPAPRPEQINLTRQGMLEHLQQNGWSLQYSEYTAVGDWNMPKKIVASRDDFTLTLYGLRWTLDNKRL